jgi:hypothetical protein
MRVSDLIRQLQTLPLDAVVHVHHGGWSDEVRVSRDEVQEHNMLEAAMCGLLTQLEQINTLASWLSLVDWKEAGVKRTTFEQWWKKHKQQDEERHARAREAAALGLL